MFARFGAALIAAVLAFAPGSRLAGSAIAITNVPRSVPSVAAAGFADPACSTYPCYTLTFTTNGTGSGRIQSTSSTYVPNGLIDCVQVEGHMQAGSVCSRDYVDTLRTGSRQVYWIVTPTLGSLLCFGSDCEDEGTSSTAILSTPNASFAYTFTLKSFTVSVTRSGTGTGSVVSTPTFINCPTSCATAINYGTSLLLTALPAPGSTFQGWTGACAGQPADCLIGIIANTSTNAIFALPVASPSAKPKTPAPPHASSPPQGTGAAPSTAVASPGSAGSAGPTVDPSLGQASAGASPAFVTPVPTDSPVPAAAESSDSGRNVVLAVLVAGLLIAIGIAIAGVALQRRRSA